jgi:hypothetical protein
MRRQSSHWWSFGLALGMAALLAGCASGGSGTGSTGGGTPTATGGSSATPTATLAPGQPTPTPVPAPPHAFSWYQYDSHNVPQIWAALNGGTPHQITHVAPDGSQCNDQIAWSPPVFSPDLHHIVASLGSFNCGDGNLSGPVSVIDASTGARSTLPSGYQVAGIGRRTMGWVNSTKIWFITYSAVFTWQLGTQGVPHQVASVSGANDAVLRGSTLFIQVNTGNPALNWSIITVDISSGAQFGGSISQGQTGQCACSPGDMHGPGWDVSRDGSHIVYSKVTPGSGSGGNNVGSTKIYYANADGSSATQIAHALTANQTILLQISPDGQWVAFTEATPSPTTLTANVNSGGGSGDPTFHAYHPDTYDYPVWKWDDSEFWAGIVPGDSGAGQGAPALYVFHRGGSSSSFIPHGYNPWYTIG